MHAGIPAGPLATRKLGPLLAEKQNQRIVQLAALGQRLQHRADLVVQRPDLGQIMGENLPHAPVADAVLRHDEAVRIEFGGVSPGPGSVGMDAAHEEQERPGIVARDELADAGGVVGSLAAHAVHRESRQLFEAVDIGIDGMVLARAGHPVALFGHVFANGLRAEKRVLVVEPRAVARGIEPRIERRPDRDAHRHRGIGAGHPQPLAGQPVDVRRFEIPAAVAADFGRQQVVRHDHYDIGSSVLCGGGRHGKKP